RQRRRQVDLTGAAARHLGKLGERRLNGRKRLARVATRTVDQAARQALGVVEENLEQMLGSELLMALAQGQRFSGLNEPAGAVRVFLDIHISSLSPTPSARPAFPPSLTEAKYLARINRPAPRTATLPNVCGTRQVAGVEPAADFRAPSRQAAIPPLTSRAMTAENAKIHAIYRYPVKGLSP